MVGQVYNEPRFIALSYCQHVEGFQALVEFPWEYFYEIMLSLSEKLT